MAKKRVYKKRPPGVPKREDVGPGRPPKEYQFKKGQVANPLGANAHNPDSTALRRLTQEALIECIEKVFTGTEEEAIALINDPTTTLGHKVILRAAVDAAHNGNYSKFNEILERVLGKVKVQVDMTSQGKSITIQPSDAATIKSVVKEVEGDF